MNNQKNAVRSALTHRESVFTEHMVEHMGESDFDLSEWSFDKLHKEFIFINTSTPDRMFKVLSESDREEQALESIKEGLCFFNPGWVACWMEENNRLEDGEDVETMAEIINNWAELYERANPMLARLIGDLEKFAKDACEEDGYAHFVSSYDDHEYEYQAPDGSIYFVYRTN